MQKKLTVMSLVLAGVLWSAPVFAQQRHVVDASAMRQAMADQATKDAQNRAEIQRVLQRPEVRNVAERFGLDVKRAERAVAVLDSAELAQLAKPAHDADLQLAGGDEIILSTTTLLLLLILIVLIVR